MDVLRWLFDAQLRVGDGFILWREVLGNVFGLLSALGGMRRKVWAWPVGIVGNAILLTVFLGAVFDTPNPVNLLGQAGRQAEDLVAALADPEDHQAAASVVPAVDQDLVDLVEDTIITAEALVGC